MKFIKATGLVPVYKPTNSADIFGVSPAVAAEGFLAGTLMQVDIPDKFETDEVDMPEWDNRDAPKKSAAVEVDERGEVVIPGNWEDAHWMTKDKLAKQIAGDGYNLPVGVTKADYAETVIREEIARREADKEEA